MRKRGQAGGLFTFGLYGSRLGPKCEVKRLRHVASCPLAGWRLWVNFGRKSTPLIASAVEG